MLGLNLGLETQVLGLGIGLPPRALALYLMTRTDVLTLSMKLGLAARGLCLGIGPATHVVPHRARYAT